MLDEYEHDELSQAVKDVVYFATRRTLSDEEKALVEWMKKMLESCSKQVPFPQHPHA